MTTLDLQLSIEFTMKFTPIQNGTGVWVLCTNTD